MTHKDSTLSDQEIASCKGIGVDLPTIDLHQRRILKHITQDTPILFPILDTCRIDNGYIRKMPASITGSPSGFLAFVPAAGAASRYHRSMVKLSGKETPLVPKAILPAVREGQTFLELKMREHRAIPGLVGQIFVAAAGQSHLFESTYSEFLKSKDPELRMLEQSIDLSTVRFDRQGRIVLETDGTPSVVPAGHGALTQLFSRCHEAFPKAHSLFVRTIDNICGTSPAVVTTATNFLRLHQVALGILNEIRTILTQDSWNSVRAPIARMFSLFDLSHKEMATPEEALRNCLEKVFFTPSFLFKNAAGKSEAAVAERLLLQQLFARPLNTMGMVPNSGKDVGGTPVVARTPFGDIHLCMEVTHASSEDHKNYFSNPAKATHFNPAFVAAEIPANASAYQSEQHPFWTIAEKTYREEKVLYHETLLYELLGNSVLSNCLFIEIPRTLFNPHKSVEDVLGRSINDWE